MTRVIALSLETAVEVVDEAIDATAVEIVVSFKAVVIVMMNVVLSVKK
jgi:hypothetical protein